MTCSRLRRTDRQRSSCLCTERSASSRISSSPQTDSGSRPSCELSTCRFCSRILATCISQARGWVAEQLRVYVPSLVTPWHTYTADICKYISRALWHPVPCAWKFFREYAIATYCCIFAYLRKVCISHIFLHKLAFSIAILNNFNPLESSVFLWQHLERSAPYRPNLPFIVSDIRALWWSGLSTRVPKCQKLKI